MALLRNLSRMRRQRAYRRFHASCDKLGIPAEVRARILKAYTFDGSLPGPVDWYGGRPG